MERAPLVIYLVLALALFGAACSRSNTDAEPAPNGAAAPSDGLSAQELENGIGPVSSVTLGAIDAALAEEGEAAFTMKCSACHKFDQRYVGPPLGGVLDRRTPVYVMNMMLNPDEMVKRHPEARAMLAEYMTPMPNQNLNRDEARAILEYFRQVADTSDNE